MSESAPDASVPMFYLSCLSPLVLLFIVSRVVATVSAAGAAHPGPAVDKEALLSALVREEERRGAGYVVERLFVAVSALVWARGLRSLKTAGAVEALGFLFVFVVILALMIILCSPSASSYPCAR